MDVVHLHLLVGWGSSLMGVLSGALIGLFFHKDEWFGGYSSFRRRMTRLGHISFFGLGLLNLLFAFSMRLAPLSPSYARVASIGFVLGAISMPICCFLTAWRPYFRYLFPIAVLAVGTGVGLVFVGYILQ